MLVMQMLMVRSSHNSLFFITRLLLVAQTVEENRLSPVRGLVFYKNGTLAYGDAYLYIPGRLLMRRDYGPIIMTQINHYNTMQRMSSIS